MKILLDKGADPNAKESARGETALMFAATFNRVDAMQALIARAPTSRPTTKVVDLAGLTSPEEEFFRHSSSNRAAARDRDRTGPGGPAAQAAPAGGQGGQAPAAAPAAGQVAAGRWRSGPGGAGVGAPAGNGGGNAPAAQQGGGQARGPQGGGGGGRGAAAPARVRISPV